MEIRIQNYLAASALLENEPGRWDTIVILDSGFSLNPFVAENSARHLVLQFDDIEGPVHGKVVPGLDHIRKAMEFGRKANRVLVSCRAGQSRSAAVATLIMFDRDPDFSPAGLLDPARHSPNCTIIDLGTQVIDNPAIVPRLKKWREDSGNLKIADHLDEIEREINDLKSQGATDRISLSKGG